MPARVEIQMDADVLARVIGDLGLENAPSFTLNHSGNYPKDLLPVQGQVRGVYHPATNHVDITSGAEAYEREGLTVLTKHVRFTVLHELRHAWQRENWTDDQIQKAFSGPYQYQPGEIDANAWADYAMPKFPKLVTIKRTQIGKSGFSRLSAVTR